MCQKIPRAQEEHEGYCSDYAGNLILGTAQNEIDDGADVCDVDFSIPVHVGSSIVIISTQDDVYDGIDICDIDLTVAIHVARLRFRD